MEYELEVPAVHSHVNEIVFVQDGDERVVWSRGQEEDVPDSFRFSLVKDKRHKLCLLFVSDEKKACGGYEECAVGGMEMSGYFANARKV